jgi:AraC-like DNA-binding protein
MPGSMTFQVVTRGSCWLEVDAPGQPHPAVQREVGRGCLTVLPHGAAHRFRSAKDAPLTPLFDIPVTPLSERYERMVFGGADGGAITHITYGVLRCEDVTAQRLLAELPPSLPFDSWDEEGSLWLHHSLQLLAREAAELRAGGEILLTRLADILVVLALRAWIEARANVGPARGWLAALRDPALGPTLAAMHRAPEAPWTVESLSAHAAMSRSSFSEKFTAAVGESPLRYLTEWRLQSARQCLRTSSDPLIAVATASGYQSEAAFSRAYKRRFGVSPGADRERPGAAASQVSDRGFVG